MFNIGFQELIIIAIIALLIVGPKKLPDLAKSLGKSFGELKRATDGLTDDIKQTMKEDEKEEPQVDVLKNSLLMKKSDDTETEAEPGQPEEKNPES
jgi:sec-independent protein translocase protein TatA